VGGGEFRNRKTTSPPRAHLYNNNVVIAHRGSLYDGFLRFSSSQVISYHIGIYIPIYIIIIIGTHESRFQRQNIFIALSPKRFRYNSFIGNGIFLSTGN